MRSSADSTADASPAVISTLSPARSTSIMSGDATPANPLMARGRLKKASKPKSKAAKKSKTTPSSQTSSGILTPNFAHDNGPAVEADDDVDDLADQLLAQLDARDGENTASQSDQTRLQSTRRQDDSGDRILQDGNSAASPGHSHSARDKLHDLKEGVKDALTPNHGVDGDEANLETRATPTERVSRQKARKLKKEQHYENVRRQAEEEMLAENDRSVQEERDAIETGCKKLNVRVREINPDGHCLYSAVADQVNMLGLAPRKEDYSTVRTHAAEIMRRHPDDFLPFLPSDVNDDEMMSPAEYRKYCDTVQNTAEWGGEPEINALSKYYQTPIHVLQAGTDLVKVGEDFPTERGPILISYHRKMYGLGEHYNSLRPASYSGSV
ncbi:OTU protein [Microbotryomycetes sp. JL201]|nr:OTU protein [Microbotryomycetes sp. JL201]